VGDQVPFKPLPSPVEVQEASEQPKQPRLTLRFLNELIKQLQQENLALANRLEQVERELEEFRRIAAETAATGRQAAAALETEARETASLRHEDQLAEAAQLSTVLPDARQIGAQESGVSESGAIHSAVLQPCAPPSLATQLVLAPRSLRHAAPKKKSFWALLFW
jgi:ABC-type transporter Mla subunit MlaD